VYADDHLSLDFASQSVTLDGRTVHLSRKEYDLLGLMVRRTGEIIPRDALLMEVWSYGPDPRTRTLDVHVRRLRVKLGNYAERGIETLIGVGYRFQPCDETH
jgi:DNA-binding response OmpR family regulator